MAGTGEGGGDEPGISGERPSDGGGGDVRRWRGRAGGGGRRVVGQRAEAVWSGRQWEASEVEAEEGRRRKEDGGGGAERREAGEASPMEAEDAGAVRRSRRAGQ